MQPFSFDTYDLYINVSKEDIGVKIDQVGNKVEELQQKIDELTTKVSSLSVKSARKPYTKKERTPEQEAELHAKRVAAGKKGAAKRAEIQKSLFLTILSTLFKNLMVY
jgi:hypothetical protein